LLNIPSIILTIVASIWQGKIMIHIGEEYFADLYHADPQKKGYHLKRGTKGFFKTRYESVTCNDNSYQFIYAHFVRLLSRMADQQPSVISTNLTAYVVNTGIIKEILLRSVTNRSITIQNRISSEKMAVTFVE
jgi:hypothetical protein